MTSSLTSLLGLLLLSPLSSSLDCQDGKIRGVNAGGWLLLEPWITPKFFEKVAAFHQDCVLLLLDPIFKTSKLGLSGFFHWCFQVNVGENLDKIVDEYTYAELVEPELYKESLKVHWDTFVTREDFEALTAAGVTHVRIPVHYRSDLGNISHVLSEQHKKIVTREL